MSQFVRLELDGPVATVTINRPEASNALNDDVRRGLFQALDTVEQTDSIRAVIVTAAGEKVFAAGSDIKDMVHMNGQESVALSESALQLNNRVAFLRKPVLCAVNGWCLGGGLELALACDIRVAAEHARFGFPEAKLGIMPGTGGVPRLLRTVAGGVARHMLLTGEFLSAQRAYEVGLVTCVVPIDRLLAETRAMASRVAALGPVALERIKHTISVAESATLSEGIRSETDACALCFDTLDKVEGMTAFIEKRPAQFKGC
ncbi:enoyl-CoA hydratase-related protein [Paraburkholderia xenovorans]|uniref:enoyl-CoA hydratase/isomerase family protein n=1 Tax=Paraburkholderia xenovorans TaxID=36873 RepID=UPI0038BBF776